LTSNPFGITSSDKVKSSMTNCFEKDGVRYGVWFASDIYLRGAYLQQARKAKKIYSSCDISIFVTAGEPSTTEQIDSSRKKIESDINLWNKAGSTPDIDHCLQAWLTEEEKDSNLSPWVVHDTFK